jgi:hypothetical protein
MQYSVPIDLRTIGSRMLPLRWNAEVVWRGARSACPKPKAGAIRALTRQKALLLGCRIYPRQRPVVEWSVDTFSVLIHPARGGHVVLNSASRRNVSARKSFRLLLVLMRTVSPSGSLTYSTPGAGGRPFGLLWPPPIQEACIIICCSSGFR